MTSRMQGVPRRKLTPRILLEALTAHYGQSVVALTAPPTTDPFELLLWENVAYLASPARRREAFEELRRTVGTAPEEVLRAKPALLQRIGARGILAKGSAAKLRACADLAVREFGGDLGSVVRRPVEEAKRALRKFPGIGEPGAEKILLLTGRQPLLAPESNGLRVLVRVGLVPDEKSYARTYAASREVTRGLPADARFLRRAHLLLQHHGRTLCKTTSPLCAACPLAKSCPSASSASPPSSPSSASLATSARPANVSSAGQGGEPTRAPRRRGRMPRTRS